MVRIFARLAVQSSATMYVYLVGVRGLSEVSLTF